MSIALLEAMALGIPVVATSIPGNRRLITNLVQGRLVAPDEPEVLARVILEQWDDFDRAVAMGRAARARVESDFSVEAMACRHLALFQEILSERPQVADVELPAKKKQPVR
jgi:glycosyltransferase involved in cell wall biosynthesis